MNLTRGSRSLIRAMATVAVLAAALSAPAQAQVTLTDSGDPGTLTVTTAIAGFQPSVVIDATTTYTAKTNNKNKEKKITGRLNTAMPAGLTLTIELTPLTGAIGYGPVTLDATARDLVGNITNTTLQTASITYRLQADVTAGVVALTSRTVTLTIVDYP